MSLPATSYTSAVHAEIASRAIANAGTLRDLEAAMAMHKPHLLASEARRIDSEYLARLAQLRGLKS